VVWACEYLGVLGQVLAGQGQREVCGRQGRGSGRCVDGRAGTAGGVLPRTEYRPAAGALAARVDGGGGGGGVG